MKTLDQIVSYINRTYPNRDYDQQCQRLVWNVIYYVMGYTSDSQMHTYATATAARLASRIESTDALAAPVGAIHYWRNPAEGHVGVSLGGGKVLMTGTQSALGEGGRLLGSNYGVTTVSAYTRRMGNPYLGWALTNGANPTIIGRIGAAGGSEDEMIRIIKTDKGDTLVVNHGDMSYWNVHEGIPAADVPKRVEWLKAQGMVEVQGLQPAAMLRGYSWTHAPENEARAAKTAVEKIEPVGGASAADVAAQLQVTVKP